MNFSGFEGVAWAVKTVFDGFMLLEAPNIENRVTSAQHEFKHLFDNNATIVNIAFDENADISTEATTAFLIALNKNQSEHRFIATYWPLPDNHPEQPALEAQVETEYAHYKLPKASGDVLDNNYSKPVLDSITITIPDLESSQTLSSALTFSCKGLAPKEINYNDNSGLGVGAVREVSRAQAKADKIFAEKIELVVKDSLGPTNASTH